jgi:hypothetical protein
MALQAKLGSLRGRQFFEIEDEAWLSTTCRHVPTGRTVAVFAFLVAMNIVREGLGIGFVAGHAQLVVVNELGFCNLRVLDPQNRVFGLTPPQPSRCPAWPSGIHIGIRFQRPFRGMGA